jgi:hypothetical protein
MKLMPALLTLLFLLLCTSARAQITDDFEDGDLLNPEWFGDTGDFVVQDGRLRLMAGDGGQSELSVKLGDRSISNSDIFSLEFLVEMAFAPSASNYCTIDLLREIEIGTNFSSSAFMRFGGVSGDQDRLTTAFVIGGDVGLPDIEGTEGALGGDPALLRFRLERDRVGTWSLLADYTGGTNFVLQGTAEGGRDIQPDLLTITCFYTATRNNKFSFDDLNASYGPTTDERPPGVSASFVLDETRTRAAFDEAVMPQSPNDYTTSLSGNTITEVNFIPGSNRSIVMIFAEPLPLREDFTITVSNLTDLVGNVAAPITIPFRYEPSDIPRPGNLIINEFMPDPNPVVGLPNAEFIELYNPSDISVRLNGVGIRSGGAPAFSDTEELLAPGEYITIVRPADTAAFRALGGRLLPIGFPALTNSGDEITLLYFGGVVQAINYTSTWYNDPDRNDGGYSIEYTGGGADAGCSASWRASQDASGGTPGRENSVLGQSVDQSAPQVVAVDANTSGVTITFSEVIDAAVFDGLLSIAPVLDFAILPFGDNGIFVDLELVEGTVYTLTILPDFSDCAGNFPAEAIVLTIALPGLAEVGDVVINEILFNPASGGADFVELYNCSDKVFQVEGWVLSNNQSTTSSGSRTISDPRLFLPGDYLTFTPDPEDINSRFREVDTRLLVNQTLPTLGDDEGNITVTAGGVILDAFDYTEDLHSELLSPNDGVSLERLRKTGTTQDGGNWFSAASTEGFATPTRENSQRRDELMPDAAQTFSLVSETFSPDGDSFEDFLELQYTTDRAGFLARIRIFDAQGRLIRTLARTELLGGTGILRWDGENNDGRKAKTGLYVLFVELFNPDGETREEKLIGVLAGRM